MSSLKFVVSSLEAIASSKDAQRNKQLHESATKALEAIKEHDELPDPEIVFAPLQLASRSNNVQLTTTALDCIGKLISYSYFSVSSTPPEATEEGAEPSEPPPPLIERAIDTICNCFQGETTAVEIQLQIVKSLLAAVLNDKIVVHGAGLLKAVRQVYNVFLLSRSTANQQVAQGTLTQMVGTVFERVKTRLHMKETRLNLDHLKNGSSNVTFEQEDGTNGAQDIGGRDESPAPRSESGETEASESGAKLTLKDLEHRKSFDDSTLGDGPTMVTQLKPAKKETDAASANEQSGPGSSSDDYDALDAEDEVYIRDAYLVFRSFCNLSTKILPQDQLYDVRGQPMRSKLISLHLIHTLLNNNIGVFTSPLCTIKNSKSNEPTSFLQAIKFYLCLSITRNGASSVDRIFNISTEIFWLMIKYMRSSFKVGLPLRVRNGRNTNSWIERNRSLSQRNLSGSVGAERSASFPEAAVCHHPEPTLRRPSSARGVLPQLRLRPVSRQHLPDDNRRPVQILHIPHCNYHHPRTSLRRTPVKGVGRKRVAAEASFAPSPKRRAYCASPGA